jgi:hypothetical protein
MCRSSEKKTNELSYDSFDELSKNIEENRDREPSKERTGKYKDNNLLKQDVLNDLDSIFMIP